MPTAIDDQLDLITIQTNLGRLYLWLERPSDATKPLESALQLSNAIEELTTSRESLWTRANCYFQAARHSAANANLPQATALQTTSKSILLKLTEDIPAQSKYAAQLDDVELEVSAVAAATERRGDIRRSLPTITQSAVEDMPSTIQNHRMLATRLHTMGRLQWAASQLEQAIFTLQMASGKLLLDTSVGSAVLAEQHAMIKGDQAAIWLEIGGTELNAGNTAEAKNAFQTALDLLTPLTEEHPDDEFFRRDLQAAMAALSEFEPSKSNE